MMVLFHYKYKRNMNTYFLDYLYLSKLCDTNNDLEMLSATVSNFTVVPRISEDILTHIEI